MASSETHLILDPLFSGLKDGVCLSNGRGEVLYLNAAAVKILGVDPDEAAGAPICGLLCAKLAAPGCGPECASVCPLPSRREQASAFQGRFGPRLAFHWGAGGLEHDDAYSEVRVHCQLLETPLFDSWEPQKQLTIIEDIGAVRELERLKEDWRNMIAHDLRSPVTNIFGTLRILEDSPSRAHLSRDEDKLLLISLRSCGRLVGLLNLYLDIAKLDAGMMRTKKEAVELSDLVDSCVAEQQVAAKEKEAKILIDIPGEPTALADAGLLFRVVQNLLANALKFAPRGGNVWIAGRRSDAQVELEIKDDGPGIAPGDRKFLFDRFFQAAARRGGKIQGTGLGLTFCREALRAMGGTIDVESEPGKGTAFVVRLPVAP